MQRRMASCLLFAIAMQRICYPQQNECKGLQPEKINKHLIAVSDAAENYPLQNECQGLKPEKIRSTTVVLKYSNSYLIFTSTLI